MKPALFACTLIMILVGCSDPSREAPTSIASATRASGESVTASPAVAPIASRDACANRAPLRQALFGDLHVHTSYSMDAFVFDTRTTPDEAYRFAQGETISIAPLDEEGRPTHAVRLARPLDFAAVTDHAESFGATHRCTRPGMPVYDTPSCRTYRGEVSADDASSSGNEAFFVIKRLGAAMTDEVCGEDGRQCRAAGKDVWREMIEVAERHYDRSAACEFTTFVAYEYGLTPNMSKVHRNVIFRNERVLDYPIHAQMETSPVHLWRRLRQECIEDRPGCDVLAIPHNPNLSDDLMFALDYENPRSVTDERRIARLRSSMEPLVEVMQVKGDSECRNGLWGVGGAVDELCGFEKVRDAMFAAAPPDCRGTPGEGALAGGGCVGRDSYARYGLVKGLAEADRIGENPLRFGFIGSTDEHKGPMGDVEEWAVVDRPPEVRLANNPGALMGVWAEENARDSIFDAMRRRETFATSGPRIQPRFFGGWGLSPDLCADPEVLAHAYESGVPMGSILPERSSSEEGAPLFLVSALRDPGSAGHPGNPLERIQIVKGWVGEDGRYMQRVYDAAGQKNPEATVDLATCEPRGEGHDSLCGVWQDPDFDSAQHAVYYARVVENPSCRWSTRTCNALEGDAGRPSMCDDARIPKTVQERAWTSPIWYDAKS